ncbi:MAG: hypothetical protein DRJ37_06115 [Thermoprotei archaeon]|nr:MAG: hypothetical protein DRJ37_06115 [Thermoprotei archaeon]
MEEITPSDLSRIFKELYENDRNFRERVDAIRSEIFDPDREPSSDDVLRNFNKLAVSLGIPPYKGKEVVVPKMVFKLDLERPKLLEEDSSIIAKRLPIIAQPKVDIEIGNRLSRIYVKLFKRAYDFSGEGLLAEITLVFEGERDPRMGIYNDLWRLIAWGRVEDIETFFLIYDEDSLTPREAIFPPLYLKFPYEKHFRYIPPSFSSGLSYKLTAHSMAKVRVKEKPVIYVNTWNHALSVFDTNLQLEKVFFKPAELKLVNGRRLDAENDFSMLTYEDEIALLEEGE